MKENSIVAIKFFFSAIEAAKLFTKREGDGHALLIFGFPFPCRKVFLAALH